jgi:hypothetical protein
LKHREKRAAEWLRFFHTWGGVEMSPAVIVHRNTHAQAHRFFAAKHSTRKSTTLRAANNEVLKPSLTTVHLAPRVSHHVKARLSVSTKTTKTQTTDYLAKPIRSTCRET